MDVPTANLDPNCDIGRAERARELALATDRDVPPQ